MATVDHGLRLLQRLGTGVTAVSRTMNYRRMAVLLLGQRDGAACSVCGGVAAPALADVEIDHILPRSQGGSDEPENLRLAQSRTRGAPGKGRKFYAREVRKELERVYRVLDAHGIPRPS